MEDLSLLHQETIDFPILENYLNGPGVAKNRHMSKLTNKGPRT